MIRVLPIMLVGVVFTAGCSAGGDTIGSQLWIDPRARHVGQLSEKREQVARDLAALNDALAIRAFGSELALYGPNLEPLKGRYIEDLPSDPWGRDYLYDGHMSLLGTYGRDGRPGGAGQDEDVVIRLTGPLWIARVQLKGDWGLPKKGDSLIVSFQAMWGRGFGSEAVWQSAPEVVDATVLLKSLNVTVYVGTNPRQISLFDLSNSGPMEHRHGWRLEQKATNWQTLVLVNERDVGPGGVEFTRRCSLDLCDDGEMDGKGTGLVRFGLRARYARAGAADPDVHGVEVKQYWRTVTDRGALYGANGVPYGACRFERY